MTHTLAIVSDCDRPEARMVAIIRDGAGVRDWCYVSTNKRLSRYKKWTALSDNSWCTPIEAFGVRASVRGNRLVIERAGDGIAFYPDGVPRHWQGHLPGETEIRPHLLRRVALACAPREGEA